MKIAIIGSGALALETSLHFLQLGAGVKLFCRSKFGGKLQTMAKLFPDRPLIEGQWTTSKTKKLIKLEREPTTLGQYFQNYLTPLYQYLIKHGVISHQEVIRVQKQHLGCGEEIPNHTRLYDLFRVVTSIKPEEEMQRQMTANPLLKEKLSEEILNSLKAHGETFEDFDIVIDCRGPYGDSIPMGSGGDFALNEALIKESSGIYYSLNDLTNEIKQTKVLTIVGTGVESFIALEFLRDWLDDEESILNIVSRENNAFDNLSNSCSLSKDEKKGLRSIIKKHMVNWREECEAIENELRNWRSLPDYERVKVKKPEFPAPKLRLYESYSVMSVDKLIDQEKIYLTLECPPWRDEKKQEMITLAQDKIIVLNGYDAPRPLLKNNSDTEIGHYKIKWEGDFFKIADGLAQIELIESSILKYFSKA